MRISQVWIDASHPFALKRVWGMTLLERVMRQAAEEGILTITVFSPSGVIAKYIRSDFWKRYKNIDIKFVSDVAWQTAADELLMIVEGHALYDERLSARFIRLNEPAIAEDSNGDFPLLAVLNSDMLRRIQKPDDVKKVISSGIQKFRVNEMDSYYRRLRSYQPVYWLKVTRDSDVEKATQYLKASVHKGTNDLIAKFIHPPFEFALTKLICNTGIQPNHVTLFNIVLAFSAIPFFYTGRFSVALLMALTKGITDGVDGKLARLTLRTSNFGDKLDHISDTIYLNCYYIAMALYFSKGDMSAFPFLALSWVIPTYFLDRVVRWFFMQRHHETVQDYRQVDVYFRLVQSNRNISMWTFLLCYLIGHPLWGYYGIIFWTPSNFIYYGIRYLNEYHRVKDKPGYISDVGQQSNQRLSYDNLGGVQHSI